MRVLHFTSQWSRWNAAAAIDLFTQATAARTANLHTDLPASEELADPRRRRRANVFLIAPTMTSSLMNRIRLILPHVLLFCTTVLYGLFGAVCFSHTERGHETLHMSRYSKNAIAAQNALVGFVTPGNLVGMSELEGNQTEEEIEAAIDRVIQTAMEAFSEGMQASDVSHDAVQRLHKPRWTFHSALYFSVTILTSVGYGNLVPLSRIGRVFCIVYGTFGIPLTLITIADIAKFLSDMIAGVEYRYRKRQQKTYGNGVEKEPDKKEPIKSDDHKSESNADEDDVLVEPGPLSKAFALLLLLIYMVVSAFACMFFTGTWNFLDAFYFCLITMTTIGFGDLDPALSHEQPEHYLGWIGFIFAGLILSTLAVDMCGSSAIERMHAWGRGIDVFSMLKTLSKGKQGNWLGAFQPDYVDIPYIDQKVRLSLMIENGYGVTYENSVGKISDSGASTNRKQSK